MAPLASEDEVRALLPDAAFKRGKELLASSKLHDVSFQGEQLERATAICGGSNPGDSYDVSVIIDPTGSSKPICMCSCPVGKGKMCKHTAALLLLRTKEFHKGSDDGSNEDENHEDAEDDDTSRQIVWVSNPEKVAPNPQAKRILPHWMMEEAVPKKKGRATKSSNKKQKVENEDGEEQPVRKKSTIRKSTTAADKHPRTRAPKQTRVVEDDDEEGERKKTGRKMQKKVPEKVEEVRATPSNATEQQEEQVAVPRAVRGRRRTRTQVVADDLSEDKDSGQDVDLTTDDLLSIAQQHLESPGGANSRAIDTQPRVDSPQPVPEPAEQPPKKRKLENSIFSTSCWKDVGLSRIHDITGGSSTSMGPDGEQQAQEQQQPQSTKPVSKDELANDMFELMFGSGFSKAVAAAPSTEKPLAPVEAGKASAPVAAPTTVPAADKPPVEENKSCSTSLQPKPKKKSSLKSQIDMLLR